MSAACMQRLLVLTHKCIIQSFFNICFGKCVETSWFPFAISCNPCCDRHDFEKTLVGMELFYKKQRFCICPSLGPLSRHGVSCCSSMSPCKQLCCLAELFTVLFELWCLWTTQVEVAHSFGEPLIRTFGYRTGSALHSGSPLQAGHTRFQNHKRAIWHVKWTGLWGSNMLCSRLHCVTATLG